MKLTLVFYAVTTAAGLALAAPQSKRASGSFLCTQSIYLNADR